MPGWGRHRLGWAAVMRARLAGARFQLVVIDDRAGGMPIDKFPHDGVALRVMAYLAFASVALRIGRRAVTAAGPAFFIIVHNTQRDIMRGRSAQV